MQQSLSCAVIGTGNIGTDLLYKLCRSPFLTPKFSVGIDPRSPGLIHAARLSVEATHKGIEWLLERAGEVDLVFDATSASVHVRHAPLLAEAGLQAVDLTPAAIGPAVIPSVNLDAHLHEPNVNLITCGGQATVPIVAAVAGVASVPYAETISTVASRSAGPGTRQNIDEFTRTTARGLEIIGGAARGKAIVVLNPAEPPILMRNTVYCGLAPDYDEASISVAIEEMVQAVATFVPGYRLKTRPIFDHEPFATPGGPVVGRVTVLLEVRGSGDYLPEFAGNLDIMTAAAVRVGESFARDRFRLDIEV